MPQPSAVGSGAALANNAAAAGTKRKPDESPPSADADGTPKQQRSKRNRVSDMTTRNHSPQSTVN